MRIILKFLKWLFRNKKKKIDIKNPDIYTLF